MNAADLATAEGETEKIVAALMTAAKSTGVDVTGAEVVVAAARRRLLASSFKVTVTFRGSAGDVKTLTTFFASATNVAALLAALKAEGINASLIVILTTSSSDDNSWIGIPIGCSLARGTLAALPVLPLPMPAASALALMRLRQQLTLAFASNPTLQPQSIGAWCSWCACFWASAPMHARGRVRAPLGWEEGRDAAAARTPFVRLHMCQ